MSTTDLNSYLSVKFVSVITGGLLGLGGPGSLQRLSTMRQ
jgi:Gamma tubulin complex component C-terminal